MIEPGADKGEDGHHDDGVGDESGVEAPAPSFRLTDQDHHGHRDDIADAVEAEMERTQLETGRGDEVDQRGGHCERIAEHARPARGGDMLAGMIEAWGVWLLVVGLAIGAATAAVLLVRLPREEDDVSVYERRTEAGWIAGTIERHGGIAPTALVEEVLDLHGAYLRARRPPATSPMPPVPPTMQAPPSFPGRPPGPPAGYSPPPPGYAPPPPPPRGR